MFHLPNLKFSFLQYRLHLAAILSLGLIGGMYSVVNAQITLTNQRVFELQDRLERLQREDQQYELDIARERAQEKIETRARALGLRPAKPEQITYLVVKNYPTTPPQPTLAANAAATVESNHSASLVTVLGDLLRRMGLGSRSNSAEAGSDP